MTPKTAHNVRQCVELYSALYGAVPAPDRPVDDETVDPDVLAYVLATTEGLGEG
jgi:hypothetical protein